MSRLNAFICLVVLGAATLGAQNPAPGPGALLGRIAAPAQIAGLAVEGDVLWANQKVGVKPMPSPIYRVHAPTGAVLSTVWAWVLDPLCLGFDSRRNAPVLASTTLGLPAKIVRISKTGAALASFVTPTHRTTGVAYDSLRDAYWVSDHLSQLVHLMDAATGTTLQPSFHVGMSGCRFPGDVGYSAVNDLVAVIHRSGNGVYLYDATGPGFLRAVTFAIKVPFEPLGCAVDPRTQTVYTSGGSPYEILRFDVGLPRVEAAKTVAVGQALPITWRATASPGDAYFAAAAFREARHGIRIGSRHVPIVPDALFILSLHAPGIFSGFRGRLDASGAASGRVVVPPTPALAGHTFSLAFLTLSPSARHGIGAISGAWRITISR